MISMIQENIVHKAIATAAGVVGGPIGGITGAIQGNQKSYHQAQLAKLNKDKKGEYDAKRKGLGRIVGKGILGSIPVVGAASNLYNQVQLDKMKKKIDNHPGWNKK